MQRLAQTTGRAAPALVEWLAPDAVDMSGEPDGFVELSQGRRLMVLAQSNGACVLLAADDSCSAYAARPRDCQAYPFDFEEPAEASAKRHLTLLPLDACEYAEDGNNDPAALSAVDRLRFEELFRYRAQVARWNRLAFHRRRLRQPIGGADEFLRFALAAESDAGSDAASKRADQSTPLVKDRN